MSGRQRVNRVMWGGKAGAAVFIACKGRAMGGRGRWMLLYFARRKGGSCMVERALSLGEHMVGRTLARCSPQQTKPSRALSTKWPSASTPTR